VHLLLQFTKIRQKFHGKTPLSGQKVLYKAFREMIKVKAVSYRRAVSVF